MAHRQHAHALALNLSALGLFVGLAACNRPDSDGNGSAAPEGFSRYPAPEPVIDLTPDISENPWIVGFGGAHASGSPKGNSSMSDSGSNDQSLSEGGLPGKSATSKGGSGTDEGENENALEPDAQGGITDPEELKPLLVRRLERYLEGEGTDKLLGLWGEPGTSPVECRIEIYSNGGVTPWRTILLPNEFPEVGTLTFCSIPADHPECTESLSGSLFNGNDALILRCGEVVMDSFGRVGEDPGEAWTSEDQTLRSEGQDLLRCGQARRLDPLAAFHLEDDWIRIENDESPEEARQKCALSEALGQGGAGAFAP